MKNEEKLKTCAYNAEDLLHLLIETPETNLTRMAKIYCYRIMDCANNGLSPLSKADLNRLIGEMAYTDGPSRSDNGF